MNPIDYVLIGILIVIAGLASYAIYRSKKSGNKCIGCPDSKCCTGHCTSCSGYCGQRDKV